MLPTPRRPAWRRTRQAALALLVPLLLAGACTTDAGHDADGRATGSGPGPASASSGGTTGEPSKAEPSKANELIASGLQQVSDKKYAEATATFNQVLALDPTNTYASYNLGYLAQLQGDEVTALQRYTATLAEDDEFAPALYNLALLTEGSDLRAAVSLYRRDIAVKPDDAPAYVRLGYALKHLGQDEEGDEMLRKGVELDPSLADATPPTYR